MIDSDARKLPPLDEERVDVRPIRASDRDEIRRWLPTISAEARYARFQSHVSDFPPPMWRYLTEVDGIDHVAFVARVGGHVVATARLVRSPDDRALGEIAFLVDDAHQRRGVGARLRDAIVGAARARGFARLEAHVLPDNKAIRRLLDAGDLRLVKDSGRLLLFEITDPSIGA